MQKRSNTIVFILAATAFNLIIMFALIGLVLLLLSWLGQERANALGPVGVALLLIGLPVAGSFVIYRYSMKWVQRKFHIDQHMGSLFGPRRRPGP